jgi:hypothetical protein
MLTFLKNRRNGGNREASGLATRTGETVGFERVKEDSR